MIFAVIVFFSVICYFLAKRKIVFLSQRYRSKPKALPEYYGVSFFAWNFLASMAIIISLEIYSYFGFVVNNVYSYLAIIFTFTTLVIYIFASLKGKFKAQAHCEMLFKTILNIASIISILVTIAILLTIVFEAVKFFNLVPIEQFILGTRWSPQSNNFVNEPVFGVIPVLVGTLLITVIAMLVAVPLGLLSAIYLSEYTSLDVRNRLKPILEILAGIPTVVYGYFAVLVVGPFIRLVGEKLGLEVSTESALAAGIVMGIMIIPFILSLSDDAMASVPQNLRDAAFALGSTKAETIVNVVIPASSAGILSGILLAISRAVGETMIVTMAAGMHAKLTLNPLDSVSTFTAQIVALLVGDQEFDSPKTLSAFALALTLFILTLFLNLLAIIAIKRHGKYYER